jgi:carotenoid cleavage dioxygenase-like enzyme
MSQLDPNKGAFAAVSDECERFSLRVEGEIPLELNGALIRNGPNPLSGKFNDNSVLSWWPESAMLHSIAFSNGDAVAYRNRWIHNQNWAAHFEFPEPEKYIASNPNVNVIKHAGVVHALAEGGQPVAIDSALNTLGATSLFEGFADGMTAHPKLDQQTQELMTFHANWNSPFLRYGVVDAKGAINCEMEISVPEPAMMHDMAITETHSILLDLNVGYDFSMLERGYRIPLCWQEDRQSRLCIVPRHGGEVRWFLIEPCFIQHVVNAFDTPSGNIVLDVVRYPWYFKLEPGTLEFLPNPLGVLYRYTIDLQNGKVKEQQLYEKNIELPRINEAYTGRKNRYVYAVEQPSDDEMRGLVRLNLETLEEQHHFVEEGDQNSEPVFVPRLKEGYEEDGWLLVCVYRQESDCSEIRILDAKDISLAPIATVFLDRRIPAGFHGAWIPS